MKCHALSILSYGSISAMDVYVVVSIYLYAAYAFSHICIVRMYACLLKFNDNIIPPPHNIKQSTQLVTRSHKHTHTQTHSDLN